MADPFLEVAVDAARRAGSLLLERFGSLREIRYKGSPSNIVTEMDRQAEALVIDCQQYCLEHLVTRLYELEPDHAGPAGEVARS